MARLSLPDIFRKRPAEGTGESGPPTPARAPRLPPPGVLRRERRALVRTREERIRDLGGLMLEMYRRDQFKQDLLIEQCLEVISIEERLREIDGLLEANAEARRQGVGSSLHVRRPDPVGIALLRQLRPPGGRGARRGVPQLRHRPPRRCAVLRELRHAGPREHAAGYGKQGEDEQTMYQQAERSGDPWEGEWASRPKPPDEQPPPTPPIGAEGGECPRCGTPYEPFQEYCLECGLRLPVSSGIIPVLATAWRRRVPWYPGDWIWPVLGALVVAALAAAVAILATTDNGSPTKTTAATGPPVPGGTGRSSLRRPREPTRRHCPHRRFRRRRTDRRRSHRRRRRRRTR